MHKFSALIIGVLVLAGPLQAQDLSIKSLPEGLYEVQGSFETRAPLDMVWGMLSDYDRLQGTVEGLLLSKVVERKGDHVVVDQKAKGSFLFFSRIVQVRLDIVESRPKSILFEDLSKLDFQVYRGRWDFENQANGSVKVSYSLTVSRGNFAPEILEQYIFKGQAGNLLAQVQARLAQMVRLSKS